MGNLEDNFYEGETYNNKPNGLGLMLFKDGSHYKGLWSEGKKHGEGKMIFSDGSSIEGTWDNDNIKDFLFIAADGTKYEPLVEKVSSDYYCGDERDIQGFCKEILEDNGNRSVCLTGHILVDGEKESYGLEGLKIRIHSLTPNTNSSNNQLDNNEDLELQNLAPQKVKVSLISRVIQTEELSPPRS